MNNGNDERLPSDRAAAVAYGLTQYQRVQDERDVAIADRDDLRIRLQATIETLEARDSRITDLESVARSLRIERDEAVSHKIKWEALFVSIQAQMRAFEVPAEPLVLDRTRTLPQHEDALAALARLSGLPHQ